MAANLFHKCCLTQSQADAIWAALKSLDRDYAVEIPKDLRSSPEPESNLLKGLAENGGPSLEDDSVLFRLNLSDLSRLCNEQIDNEMKGKIFVIYSQNYLLLRYSFYQGHSI